MATRSKISGPKLARFQLLDRWEPTVDERVQDGHGTVGNTGVRVHLLEN